MNLIGISIALPTGRIDIACPVPFAPPGLVLDLESLLRRVCCPVAFMVTSSGVSWLQMETHRVVANHG